MAAPPLCGGVTPVESLDDPEHHEFIQAALASSDGHAGRSYKIIRATRQVVAGSLHTFYITFEDGASNEMYKITAWSRPWLKDKAEALKLTFEKHNEQK